MSPNQVCLTNAGTANVGPLNLSATPSAAPPGVTAKLSSVGNVAATLIAVGFAVCRIRPGEKRPTYPGWSTASAVAGDFQDGDSVGIVCGPISAPSGRSLVCVDLDSEAANARADDLLPYTPMVDGRPGKPESHRWYVVRNDSIPVAMRSTARQASAAAIAKRGHPGPWKKAFDVAGERAIDFIGTGGQAVVPPSLHKVSGEYREWGTGQRGEPAAYDFLVLWQAVCDLAEAIGWRASEPKQRATPPDSQPAATADATPDADECDFNLSPMWGENPYALTDPATLMNAERRSAGWCLAIPTDQLPRTGHGGDGRTYSKLAALLYGFCLPVAAVLRVFADKVNDPLATVGDAWDEAEITRKIDWLLIRGPHPDFPVGELLNAPAYSAPPAAWDDPGRLAREFRKGNHVVSIRDMIYIYRDGCYKILSDESFRALVRAHIDEAAIVELSRQVREDADRRHDLTQALAVASTPAIEGVK